MAVASGGDTENNATGGEWPIRYLIRGSTIPGYFAPLPTYVNLWPVRGRLPGIQARTARTG